MMLEEKMKLEMGVRHLLEEAKQGVRPTQDNQDLNKTGQSHLNLKKMMFLWMK